MVVVVSAVVARVFASIALRGSHTSSFSSGQGMYPVPAKGPHTLNPLLVWLDLLVRFVRRFVGKGTRTFAPIILSSMAVCEISLAAQLACSMAKVVEVKVLEVVVVVVVAVVLVGVVVPVTVARLQSTISELGLLAPCQVV